MRALYWVLVLAQITLPGFGKPVLCVQVLQTVFPNHQAKSFRLILKSIFGKCLFTYWRVELQYVFVLNL